MAGVGDRTKISGADTDEKLTASLEKARKVLLSGGIVGFPTESFYGLAVDIENDGAIEKLFSVKKRDKGKPILIILPNLKSLEKYVEEIPDKALRLISEFWPGGLTLIFKANRKVSPLLTSAGGKIGIRYSGHPVASLLAETIGRPVTGTSANISGYFPCVDAKEVYRYFKKTVNLIIDGGRTKGGKGSTILDITKEPPVIIREGIIPGSDIQRITG